MFGREGCGDADAMGIHSLALGSSGGGIGLDAYSRIESVSCGICAKWY